MRAIWSGSVRSANRVERSTGLPTEYRLVVYDDGSATCSCPAFFFQTTRNPERSPEERMRFRCKHLSAAFASNTFSVPTEPTQPVVDSPATGTPAPLPTVPEARPLFDDDDDELFEPQVRR